MTLTAVETQLTKGFSLSPAATARHSDVASGKAAGFPCGPSTTNRTRGVAGYQCYRLLPRVPAAPLLVLREPAAGPLRSPGCFAKIRSPEHSPPRTATASMVRFTRMHARLFCQPPCRMCIYLSTYLSTLMSLSVHPSVPYIHTYVQLYLYPPSVPRREYLLEARRFFFFLSLESYSIFQVRVAVLHYHCYFHQ